MTIAALLVTRFLGWPGDKSLPVFLIFMFLGIPLGEFLERRSLRSKAE